MASNTTPGLDHAAGGPLRSDFAGDADMAELVTVFVDELQQRADALRAAFAAGDCAALKTLSHQLKGAAGGYGFPSITSQAAKVEAAVKAAPPELKSVGEQLDALIALCRRACAS